MSPVSYGMMLREPKRPISGKNRRPRRTILLTGFALSGLLFVLSLAHFNFTDFLNQRVYDILLSDSPGEPSSTPVIVDIDEKSLKEYGQWPWPRYRIALLLDKLSDHGVSSIGLDMLFAEDDRTSIHVIRRELLRDFRVDLRFREVPPGLRDNDQRLVEALGKAPVVLGYQFLFEESPNPDPCLLHPLHVNRLGSEQRERNSSPFIRARSVSCNLPKLSRAAAASGFFNVSPDPDGILRRVPLVIEHEDNVYPSLALATLMRAQGATSLLFNTGPGGEESLHLHHTVIPLTSRGSMLVRFRGKGKTLEYVSASDVLSDRVPDSRIRGRIVFIGTSASGMKEHKSTPFDPVFPGVEIHATVVDNILKKDFLSRPRWAPLAESFGGLVLGLFAAWILTGTGAAWSSIVLGGIGVGACQASVWAFRTEGIFLSPVFSLIVLACNFSVITLLKFRQEEQRVRERTCELAMVQEATIESMSSLTETRDPDTGGHIKRTQNYIRLLSEYLKNQPEFRAVLDDETIDLLFKSAPLHDIGKVGVSDKILLKPGKLTVQEFEEMKLHTVYGRDAILAAERKLGDTSFLRVAREMTYTHHERWDGSGYPEGLRGEQIPLPGRLMALVDTYDALTSNRVYKSQIPHENAVEIIRTAKGTQFDPAVVNAFLEVHDRFREISLTYADREQRNGSAVMKRFGGAPRAKPVAPSMTSLWGHIPRQSPGQPG